MTACLQAVRALIVEWPLMEALLGLGWLASVLAAWRNHVPPMSNEKVEERDLGATVILGQLNGIVTGTSIIIAGLAAFVALKTEERTGVSDHLT